MVLHRFGRDRPPTPTGGRADPALTAASPAVPKRVSVDPATGLTRTGLLRAEGWFDPDVHRPRAPSLVEHVAIEREQATCERRAAASRLWAVVEERIACRPSTRQTFGEKACRNHGV